MEQLDLDLSDIGHLSDARHIRHDTNPDALKDFQNTKPLDIPPSHSEENTQKEPS